MKKSMRLVGVALLAVSSLASADGFYVGAGVGALQLTNTFGYNASDTGAPDINLSQTGHGTSINGTALLGYAWDNPSDFYLGLEAFQNISDAQASAVLNNQYVSLGNLHLKMQNAYGIRLLPGLHFTPDTVAYGIVGLAHGKLQLTDDSDDETSYHLNGYQVGVGAMTKITSNLSLRGDVIYTGYVESIDSRTETFNEDTSSESFSVKPSTLEANVGMVYSFG